MAVQTHLKHDTLWKAPPHTIYGKLPIIREYAMDWTLILGRSFKGCSLVWVDCFAGPGEYTNYPNGSPIEAILAMDEAIDFLAEKFVARDIRLFCIEERPDRVAHLKNRLAALGLPRSPRIHVEVLCGTFADCLSKVAIRHPLNFTGSMPLFMLIDPFGLKGVPFDAIQAALSSKTSEVLINFDVNGALRLEKGYRAIIDAFFGCDQAWDQIRKNGSLYKRCREALSIYERQLTEVARASYLRTFTFLNSAGVIEYFLVFAGRHETGLRHITAAMKKVDQSMGFFSYHDAHAEQRCLDL